MDIDTRIDNFMDTLSYDGLVSLAKLLSVDATPPPTGDMWIEWQDEFVVEVAEELRKVVEVARILHQVAKNVEQDNSTG